MIAVWAILNIALLVWAAMQPSDAKPFALVVGSYTLQLYSWPIALAAFLGLLICLAAGGLALLALLPSLIASRRWVIPAFNWGVTIAVAAVIGLSTN